MRMSPVQRTSQTVLVIGAHHEELAFGEWVACSGS
jgi:hypothetical protein